MTIVEIGLAHCELLSALHGECFDEHWSQDAFADLVGLPATFGFIAYAQQDEEPLGFVLCQGDALESEIILIATRTQARRQGIARALLAKAFVKSQRIFLEVGSDNPGAIAFYDNQNFKQVGLRKGYYKRPDGRRVDALVMACEKA